VFELRDTVAYVAIESPEKRCGKTTLLSVLAAMAHKPLISANITASALFRAIDTFRPTLFIDEADTFLAGSSTIRGIINSGNTWRTAYVLRMSKSRKSRGQANPAPVVEDADSTLKRYNCWCPKVVAMIGQVPDTIADRSIVVLMCRKLVSETRAPLSELDTIQIKAKCARFALDSRQTVAECEKIRGEGLNDRAADTFDPLYVIARMGGTDWEQKLNAAANALVSSSQPQSPRCELLLDIYSIFILSGNEKLFSSQLAATLRDGGCGMKSVALKYSSITEYQICKTLRPYGIKPCTIRIGKEVNKGYRRDDFRDAFLRYVPNADRKAWAEEIGRRADLQLEANKEARDGAERAKARGDESFMAELFERVKRGA
ncbi:MAG TPA: DUF3631 domain-containing protein, partial [Verrucomicrobiae bacterium]|nr:DUF3631 domain-containing protein [Verrucomicrobiae bacterium]